MPNSYHSPRTVHEYKFQSRLSLEQFLMVFACASALAVGALREKMRSSVPPMQQPHLSVYCKDMYGGNGHGHDGVRCVAQIPPSHGPAGVRCLENSVTMQNFGFFALKSRNFGLRRCIFWQQSRSRLAALPEKYATHMSRSLMALPPYMSVQYPESFQNATSSAL
jgi:hypothetical protein